VKTIERAIRWGLVAVATVALWAIWPQSFGGHVAYVKVDGWSMVPTYHFGDLAVVRKQTAYQLGDPVAYRIPKGEFGAGALVIHRLIGGDGSHGYVTKGDNRSIKDPWHPHTADIVGKVNFDVPGGGNMLVRLATPVNVGGLVAALTVMVMLFPSGGPRRGSAATPNGLVLAASNLTPDGHSAANV
jgi:signal peptidase